MPLVREPSSVYRSELLSAFPWIEHGFGSRHAEGWPGEYTRVKQTHSDIVLLADGRQGVLGEGDAIVTSEPDQLIGIRTADCMPILLADVRKRVVAAAHAGWKGTVQQIARRTVETMRLSFDTRPEDVYAVIGPGIGNCCFEVGPEVAVQFGDETRRTVDLPSTNRQQLIDSGVPASQIELSGACTMCNPAEFHSYRRDREASGRMVAAIGIRGGRLG